MLTKKRVGDILLNNAVILLLLLSAVVVGIMQPAFFSAYNMRNLMVNTAVRFIVAVGVSGCLIMKGTDLSAGRQVGLAACLAATFLQRADYGSKVYPNFPELPVYVILIGVVLIGCLLGAFNGVVISIFKVPPFIATLGTQTIVFGATLVFTGSSPIGGLRDDYKTVANGLFLKITWLPYLLFIAIAVGLLWWFIYNKTPHGKRMYALGGNEASAEVSGINTTQTKIIIYILAGLLYSFAGFLLGAKAGGANAGMGMNYELEAIAGCTIGGVSTNGGVGRISGILIGVLVFELLKIAMQFMGVQTEYTYVVQGLVIIVAVTLDMRKYIAKK